MSDNVVDKDEQLARFERARAVPRKPPSPYFLDKVNSEAGDIVLREKVRKARSRISKGFGVRQVLWLSVGVFAAKWAKTVVHYFRHH